MRDGTRKTVERHVRRQRGEVVPPVEWEGFWERVEAYGVFRDELRRSGGW